MAEQLAIPFLSECCGAPLQSHGACGQFTQCRHCRTCKDCGAPSYEPSYSAIVCERQRIKRERKTR